MANFDKAIPVILMHEGGWVSNPADPGGETNFGVSTMMIKRLQQDEGLTNAQIAQLLGVFEDILYTPGYMKTMHVEAAKAIYRKYFWDQPGYGRLTNDTVATKIMDVGVNCGTGRANKMAQRAANKLGQKLGEDGKLGALSIAGINACDPKSFLIAMSGEQLAYYQAIVVRSPSLGVFLRNWTKRAGWMG